MSFQDLAENRRISTARPRLGLLDWEVSPDAYQRLSVSGGVDATALLRLMIRRGLEPELVLQVFAELPDRPIERALIAYDVLRDSLLGFSDTALVARVASERAPLDGLATPRAAVPRQQVRALREAFHRDDSFLAQARRQERDPSALPSLAALALDETDLAADAAARETVFAHVRRLASAHLPSLAIAFLQLVYDRFALPSAREMLVELGLDHDLLEAVPQIPETDDASMQLQTYLVVRASLAQFDIVGAAAQLSALREHPGVAGSTNLSLLLVDAHLSILQGKRLDPASEAAIGEISHAGSGWRYARQVADAVAMPGDPENIAARLDSYLTAFGNDAHVWGQAFTDEAARPALITLLSRELRYGSYTPAVWRALSIASGDEAIDNQVTDRIADQLRVFAS